MIEERNINLGALPVIDYIKRVITASRAAHGEIPTKNARARCPDLDQLA